MEEAQKRTDLDKFKSIVDHISEIIWGKKEEIKEEPVEEPQTAGLFTSTPTSVGFDQKELNRRRARMERRKAQNIK